MPLAAFLACHRDGHWLWMLSRAKWRVSSVMSRGDRLTGLEWRCPHQDLGYEAHSHRLRSRSCASLLRWPYMLAAPIIAGGDGQELVLHALGRLPGNGFKFPFSWNLEFSHEVLSIGYLKPRIKSSFYKLDVLGKWSSCFRGASLSIPACNAYPLLLSLFHAHSLHPIPCRLRPCW